MAYVDKFNIGSDTYIISDTEGREETNKKIDINTNGDLEQTVSGDMSITGKSVAIKTAGQAGNEAGFEMADDGTVTVGTPQTVTSKGTTNIRGPVKFSGISATSYNDNFDVFPITDSNGNTVNLAAIKPDANFKIIDPSPTSIEKYQELKKDGTDDITDTINTHTVDEPLFIPVGTYKISAPLQLKHSLYGAGYSRDPARGTSDTILKYTDNPTAFGSLGVITVSGDDVTGNIVVGNLGIICNGMIGGVVFTTNKYTDNYIYNVGITNVKSYGVYLQPTTSTLSRYVYMDNVSVWGFSDNKPKERWDDNVAFYWGTRSPDCICNNLLAMVCQGGFLCNTNVIGSNWITYNGIPSGGSGGTDANTWWEGTFGVKVVNNDVHITNLYLDTLRRGFIFDGPGKAAAYVCNLIYTCNDDTATTATGYAALALIGTSPSAQLIVDTGIINRSAKVSTTIQTIGTYDITSMVCKLNGVYIYTKRDYIFNAGNQYICAPNEHRVIDSAITNQVQYVVSGQSVTGDPTQYKAVAFIPNATSTTATQGELRIFDDYNMDMTVLIRLNPTDSSNPITIHGIDNRKLNVLLNTASSGTVNLGYELSATQDSLYYVTDANGALIIYVKLPASRTVNVQISGFLPVNSPVVLDLIRNEDGTPMDYPRWGDASGMNAISILRPTIS